MKDIRTFITESKWNKRPTESYLHLGIKETPRRVLMETQEENHTIVDKFLNDIGWKNGQLEWTSENTFVDAHGFNGYIFDTEEEAEESVLNGDEHQNAIDYVNGAQTDEDWIKYLIKGGVNPSMAERIINNGDWNSVVNIIVDKEGPEFFLSTYSGRVNELPNGKLLYF